MVNEFLEQTLEALKNLEAAVSRFNEAIDAATTSVSLDYEKTLLLDARSHADRAIALTLEAHNRARGE